LAGFFGFAKGPLMSRVTNSFSFWLLVSFTLLLTLQWTP
jgi:hypothetical protein